jgi:nucleotide sugar dehydrogenase
VQGFYDTIVECTVPVSGPKVAEMTKLLENTFRHVNIAMVNEMAMFAGELGVDIWESIAAASTKPFGYMTFTPGPGVGGHCLPVDPSYLSWKVKQAIGTPFRFVELANDVNDHMPNYVVRRAMESLNEEQKAINGSNILVLGLSYKKNTGDARESPGPVICELLASLGAKVYVADPHVNDRYFPTSSIHVELNSNILGIVDLAIITIDHDIFDWDLLINSPVKILDTRHCLVSAPLVEYL